MKQRAASEPPLSDHFLAVCPVSLQFDRNYKTRFHLYFQKNLQIISKHATPLPQVKKDEITQFPTPEAVNHFRIHSQKSLEYHWSLYIFRVDKQKDNEQFIEGQKVALADIWNEYKSSRNTFFQRAATFNVIRCKLNYLVVIGSSNQQLLDLTQKYFNDNKLMSGITTDQKIVPESQNGSELGYGELKSTEYEKIECGRVNRVEQEYDAQFGQNYGEKAAKIQQLEDIKISNIIYRGRNSLQSRETELLFEKLLSPREEQDPKLSNSELEIGRQIQEQINSKEASLKGKVNVLSSSNRKMLEPEEKPIRMTSSQILNDKKEVIVPIYQQKKFIIIFFCLLALLIGSGLLTLTSGPKASQAKNRKKKGKKTRQTNKQVQPKKSKGKK